MKTKQTGVHRWWLESRGRGPSSTDSRQLGPNKKAASGRNIRANNLPWSCSGKMAAKLGHEPRGLTPANSPFAARHTCTATTWLCL